jgi:hypothetical protein
MHSGRTRCEREVTLAQRKLRHISLAGSNYVRSRRPRPGNGSSARSCLGRPQGSIHCARIAGSGGPLDIHSSLERGPTTQARFRSQQLLKDDSIRHQPGVLEHSSFSPQWLPPRGLGQPRRNGRLRNWAGGRTIDGQGQRRLVVGQLERLTGQQCVGCGSRSGRHSQPSTAITEVQHQSC